MKVSISKTLCLFLTTMLLAVLLTCIASAEGENHVVILATSDMHGNIWGYSYEDNAETDNNGMARLYTYIQQVREENPTVFLVDAGDVIQGTIMTDNVAIAEPDNEHPVIAAMNYMGYDTMTLGNHEFNWGTEIMKKIINQASFPVLAANIMDPDGSLITGKDWTIIERGGIRLAVIGVCTPNIPIWDGGKDGVDDAIYEAGSVAVKKALEEIRDQADIILVSAHMGQSGEFDPEGGSDSGEKIVEDNPEVDILQVAHMHVTVDDRIGKTAVVGVRNSAREIARIDVTLDEDRKIQDITTQIVGMADYEPSEEIREIPVVKKLHEQTINFVQGIGEDGKPREPLGFTTKRFQPEDEIKGLPEGKLEDTAVIDLILDVQLACSGADVTSCALFKDTSDLPEGSINYGNIFDIYKYNNTLCRVEVTGRELKEFMEKSAECYNQWTPGDINISFDPEYPSYVCDMFAGVDYEINLSRPKGERIENVMFRGEPLRDDQVLKLAVNNYRYTSMLKGQNIVENNYDWESSSSIRDMLVDYFAKNSPIEPTVNNNWHITGVDLSEDDPRRDEIIGYINEGLLPTPYYESYNLEDYDRLSAEAQENKAAGITVEDHESH